MMGFYDGWGWFGMIFGGLTMLFFWGLVIALIVWAIAHFGRSVTSEPSQTPLEIARRRYAKGEISREEFEQIKRDIS